MVNGPAQEIADTLGEFLAQQIAEAAAAGYPRCIGCGCQLGPQWQDLPTQDDQPVCGHCAVSVPPALCQCCLSAAGRPPTLAVYRWTGPHGNVTPLCAACCDHWRAGARDDPSLAPLTIERIER